MADTIQSAQSALFAERDRLSAEITELEWRVATIDTVLSGLQRLAGANGTPRPVVTRPPREGTIGRAIEDFLKGKRKPVHADDVLAHLVQAGRAPAGKDPRATVQTTLAALQRRGRVRNAGRNQWLLSA